ncbi:aminoglycoside phosphotransferase family protein [Halomonas beimenensis]|uniref:Putative phosphotransferase related to Ser/Thr protein kinase n=1 Tax=Halomonas beimenensis TaxID=475662 RepID=A0A291P4B7_9GAMM|nr:phosphotransferase [Halomonas beimenensis]ATJ81743.1 putative phosphotransferase related to Ser/Thr protein kinase [Halomonas beimenensis]
MPEADALPRQTRLRQWAARHHGLDPAEVDLRLAAGDASFRRYYRLTLPDGTTRMLMDAPPDREDSAPFVSIDRRWAEAGLPVPALHGLDLEAGFLELDDLGDTPLQMRLGAADDPDTLAWYERALALLDALQTRAAPQGLPAYDAERLGRELDLFPDWCLQRWLDLPPPPGWASLREALIAAALAQPVVTVHRDFDAMNLMVVDERLFLIDFQDAVAGPLSYDLISLLHGRYCRFAPAQRAAWVEAFRARAVADGRLDASVAPESFRRDVAAMAAQRSLKVLGIFCRLTLRDRREGYLARLPLFLTHLEDALAELGGHAAFRDWLADRFRPALGAKLAEAGIAREDTP